MEFSGENLIEVLLKLGEEYIHPSDLYKMSYLCSDMKKIMKRIMTSPSYWKERVRKRHSTPKFRKNMWDICKLGASLWQFVWCHKDVIKILKSIEFWTKESFSGLTTAVVALGYSLQISDQTLLVVPFDIFEIFFAESKSSVYAIEGLLKSLCGTDRDDLILFLMKLPSIEGVYFDEIARSTRSLEILTHPKIQFKQNTLPLSSAVQHGLDYKKILFENPKFIDSMAGRKDIISYAMWRPDVLKVVLLYPKLYSGIKYIVFESYCAVILDDLYKHNCDMILNMLLQYDALPHKLTGVFQYKEKILIKLLKSPLCDRIDIDSEFINAVKMYNILSVSLFVSSGVIDPSFDDNKALILANRCGHTKIAEILRKDPRVGNVIV